MPFRTRRRHARLLLTAVATAAVLTACASSGQRSVAAAGGAYRPGAGTKPVTRAERSNFTETSSPEDVRAFLDSLATTSEHVAVGTLGTSADGRPIPYIVASRPRVSTPGEARVLDRPIVFVQGGIHGGEVEGKDALLALVRDLALESRRNLLDSVVLIAVPMYNPDGASRLGPQERNRSEQNGPALVGERANGDSVDLNRDYVKAEGAETRAALHFFNTWHPDVVVDLHTTNGSYHGYRLTYAPPLNPASLIVGPFVRDTVLPALRERLHGYHRIETFPYGNFVSQDSVARGWFTYDHRPRYGVNYMGLRGRPAILFEGYSHDPYIRRVGSAYTFVYELLELIADNAGDFLDISREADRRVTGWGTQPASAPQIPIRAELRTPSGRQSMLVETLERTGDSVRTEAGLPPGVRRGAVRRETVPIYDRFTPTLYRFMPYGYAIPLEYTGAIDVLRRHGFIIERLPQALPTRVERFTVDSVVRAERPFQRHRTVRLEGTWAAVDDTLPAGTVLVRSGQPLAILAMYLLEAQSDDGLATWNFFDQGLREGGSFPVVRLTQPVTIPLTVLDR
ncbi:MAG TPA: M14 family metallopeptidase [Gemmatimonadaceae bacterium]|nr:M14 family metallopeptidase [Gemmatimonadaceae bacterium]